MRPLKTLGPLGAHLITTLQEQRKTIFSMQDVHRIAKSSEGSCKGLVHRLVGRGIIARLSRSHYAIIPQELGKSTEFSPNWYVIAKHLSPKKYYCSYASAMDIHGMVTQPVTKVYVSVDCMLKPKKILGIPYHFVYHRKFSAWGLTETFVTPQEKVVVSDLEFTILECLGGLNKCGGLSEIAKGIWLVKDKIDFEKLKSYVKKLKRYTVTKRLGMILETYKIGGKSLLKFLQKSLNKKYDLLDPLLPSEGKYQSRWRLRINVEPEELLQVVRT